MAPAALSKLNDHLQTLTIQSGLWVHIPFLAGIDFSEQGGMEDDAGTGSPQTDAE